MDIVIEQIKAVPEYLKNGFQTHTIIAVIILVLFLFVLFFTNKVASILRNIFIAGCILAIVFAVITDRYSMIWAAVFALIVLAIVRIILSVIRTKRQDRINARIEERALAKAAKRRGSWKNKQGYSGEAKPIVDDYTPSKMDEDEIKDLVENENPDAKHEEYLARTKAVQKEAEEAAKAAEAGPALAEDTESAAGSYESASGDTAADTKKSE